MFSCDHRPSPRVCYHFCELMHSTGRHSQTIRFGPFEADLFTQELRKHGTKLKLSNQSFQVLSCLLHHPGQLVTREELRELLWPADTFVEYDQGLNAIVNRLRDALGDSPENPRYIETLPRRGYRFISPIETAISEPAIPAIPPTNHQTATATPPPAPEIANTPLSPRTRTNRFALASAVILAALLVYAVLRFKSHSTAPDFSSVRVLPFTSFPGQEVAPTFSPDGSEIAFAWKSDSAKGFDLYVKSIGSEHLLRLTDHPAQWINPAWSPDGTQIAFARWSSNDSGIYLISPLGGPERKLADANFWYAPFAQVGWSPDAKSLVFWSNRDPRSGIYLLPMGTLQPRQLNFDLQCWDLAAPAFSPDGKSLAFVCTSSVAVYQLYVAPLSGGSPRRLAAMMGYFLGLSWSADGTRLIFSNDSGEGGQLWQVDMGGQLTKLPFGEQGSAPAISARRSRLAYVRGWKTINIWRIDLAAPRPESSTRKLIDSTRIQRVPQYSPDGSKILFESNRSGSHEIWLADADGGNPIQLTSFNGPQTGAPAWCSDGKRIAFDSRASGISAIYEEDVAERIPHLVQTDVRNLAIPTWAAGCHWLFASDGHDRLYRFPAQGGPATRVTSQASWYGFVNGLNLFFNVKTQKGIALWSKPVDAAQEAPLPGMPELSFTEDWTATSRGIYYTNSTTDPPTLNYYDFHNRTAKPLFSLPKNLTPSGGLAVSPDRHWFLYTQTDDQQSDIMLVDHFK
jgi:Tol biopolymer transport system component/DNA-binding winged helix-turn-helix (wHTH) protein